MVTSCSPLANLHSLGVLIMQAPEGGVRRRPARAAVIGCDKVAIGCLVQIHPPNQDSTGKSNSTHIGRN